MPSAVSVSDNRLPNGLRVLVHTDHTAPVVAVNLWYGMGSRHEQLTRTGFAHLFEHLTFQGSRQVAGSEHFSLMQGVGATLTARRPLTARTTTRPSPATPWNWRCGSRPTGWVRYWKPLPSRTWTTSAMW